MPGPVPGLIQDDSHVRYCNADELPEKYDVAPDGQIIYHCPHLIPLELDKVYEFILLDNTTSTTLSHPIHMHGDPFEISAYCIYLHCTHTCLWDSFDR